MVQSFTSAEKSTRVPAAHCTKPNLPWRIQHFVLHLEVRRGQPDMLAQSCWWIPQACRWSACGRRDLVENPRTWSAPHHWVHQTRLDLTTVTQQNWLETRIFTAMITNWSVYGNTWIITVNWFVPKKGKEECLYNALYILCIAQSAQAWITQFYLQVHHACLFFVSVHQIAPPLTEVRDIQLQLTTHLSTPKGWKAELAWLVDP